ncbi:LON peptidase N-terminal domain and RING finger protein 3 [Euwallacea similis]|uniref:LON peptidase N-terminal domain and RING finger protein 3 n=1 Tax=Euwallacea similis TaxID=1736056 RepID=UPI00344B58E2
MDQLPRQDKSTQSNIHQTLASAIANNRLSLFSCSACARILRHPVTIKCGHTMCLNCLDKANMTCRTCMSSIDEEPFKINVLVQNLIEKWKERNKMEEMDSPVFRLLLRPRYKLRSRSAGLQCSVDVTKLIPKRRRKHQPFQVNLRRLCKRTPNCRKPKTRLERKRRDSNLAIKDSFHKVLQNILNDLQVTLERALRNSWNCITEEDLECLLCRRSLVDPVTTPCGHTFCRDCLTRVLDHRLTCPLCVSKLSVGDYFRATTGVLDQAIQFLFPNFSNKHVSSSQNDDVPDQNIEVPVFVCTNAFPGVACPLYVNEPRYRLLIRRCLQNPSKTFAMVSTDPCGAKFMQYGTILEVRDAVTLEDGRIILSTQGIRRFRVMSGNEKDGYDTAKIEHIRDARPKHEDVSSLESLHQKVYTRAVKWIHLLSPSALSEVERLIGRMPRVEKDWIDLPDGPSWMWWLIPILPLSSHLQMGFLSSTNLEKRLRAIDKMLEHMKIRMKAVPREESEAYAREDEIADFCSEQVNN